MKKSYYLFNPGRLSRKDNTLCFIPVNAQGQEGPAKYLPVEGVENLYTFGSLDANSSLYLFLGKQQITVHFFDYYEHYTGSFMPKDYLLAGKMQVAQVQHYGDKHQRLRIARSFIEGAAFNMLKNLRYYASRGRELQAAIIQIEAYMTDIPAAMDVAMLMGTEGNIRQVYYAAFNEILKDHEMLGRSKQPPLDPVNALISFGNMMCYTLCLDQLYHTQLNPTISFLHEPGFRRYSLALDLAEVFKPLLVDRTIFRLLNKKEIQLKDFDGKLNFTTLKDSGRQAFIRAWEERLGETIQHRSLKRKVSYKRLVRLEAYKLQKHILDIHPYHPFKMWW